MFQFTPPRHTMDILRTTRCLWRRLPHRHFTSYKPIKRPGATLPASESLKFPTAHDVSLMQRITKRIQTGGPITVAHYMREVLTNPSAGYYMHRDMLGQQGDFITSPEIGQIFGELVAIWLYAEWQKIGSPKPLQLVELGPGRGTLIQDVIRVLSKFGLSSNLSVHMVEISQHLSELQSQRICFKTEVIRPQTDATDTTLHYRQGETVSGIPVYWYERIEDVPVGFTVVLAHEFFDALPVHKFQRVENKWREILVELDPARENGLRLVTARKDTPMLPLFLQTMVANDQRQHIERSFEALKIVEHLAVRLEQHGGFALIMDYGHSGDKGDTFRAFKKHQLHDPLVEPGTADLTADVDYQQMQCIAEKDDRLITFGPVEQQDFMKRLGGDARLQRLVESAQGAEAVETLQSGYDMLTNPQKMGARFKFFSLFPSVLRAHLAKYPVNGFH